MRAARGLVRSRTLAYRHPPLEKAEEAGAVANGPIQEKSHAELETSDWLRRAAQMFVPRFYEGKGE